MPFETPLSPADLAVELPILTLSPTRYARCCLPLSRPLVDTIVSHLPAAAALALSIGSGSGLLEQLLRTANPRLDFHGVEVPGAENVYLPEERVHRVVGAWQVCRVAAEASIWMFVYPRSPSLVRSYLDGVRHAERLEVVAWIGPTVDWEDFKLVFQVNGLSDEICDPKVIPLTDSEIMVLVALRSRVADSAFHQMVDSL